MGCDTETVGSFDFPVCTKCQDGLHLLRNKTASTLYPSSYSFCVPDCREAHASYVNTQSGTCDWTGEYCQSGHWTHGCERCQGDVSDVAGGSNWISTFTTSEQLQPTTHAYSTIFKECVPCLNSKYCTKCLSTDTSKCQACSVSGSTPCPLSTSATGFFDTNCLFKSTTSANRNCVACKDGYYIKVGGGTSSAGTGSVLYNNCAVYSATNTAICLTATAADTCSECDYTYGIKATGTDKKCYSCNDDKFYPGILRCNIDVTTGTPTAATGCKDGYADTNGNCVTNCGVGKYGKTTYSSRGMIIDSKCYSCNANCHECVGAGINECISCKKGYYLLKGGSSTWGLIDSFGTCTLKAVAAGGILTSTIYVKNDADLNTATDTQTITGVIQGATNNPFNFLNDAISKAYELGAPYTKAKITIKLSPGQTGSTFKHTHYIRPLDSTERPYIPTKLDYQQTTEILIESDVSTTQVVYYKLRDKFTFPVGAGLTIKNVQFDAYESSFFPEKISDMSQNKEVTKPFLQTWFNAKDPTENCLMTQGLGAGLFTFDINSETMLTTPPTLTLDTVEFLKFEYEFNSLIEMNPYGGKVVITNSNFNNINTCGSIIRNKFAFLDKSTSYTPATGYDDYYTYYLMRSNKYLYDLYINKYSTITNPYSTCTDTSPCLSISIDGTTFEDINTANKDALSTPVTVSQQGKMQYYGMILDLDGFSGSVIITNSIFQRIGPRYTSCEVAPLFNVEPTYSAANDKYQSFGAKTKYQIKSLISIVNHKYTADFIGNTFTSNTGTKGIIYLDMKHKTNMRRAVFVNNIFQLNGGYIDGNVIFVRARGPYEGGSIYTRIPYDLANAPSNPTSPTPGADSEPQTTYHCSGYHFQANKFQENIGCPLSSGGVLKFECVDYSETSSSANDRIMPTSLSSATLQSYKEINFAGHVARYETSANQVQVSGTRLPVDLNQVTFKLNEYVKNFGSGGYGLVDVRGAPRVSFDSDKFTYNGDSVKEIIVKLTSLLLVEDNSDMTMSQSFNNNGGSYPSSKMMKSLIHVERASQVTMSNLDYDFNWMSENLCAPERGQLATFNDFGGILTISDLTVYDHNGVNNIYVTQWANLGIGLGGLSTIMKTASKTPLFYFSNTVSLSQATFTDWDLQRIQYYEDTTCTDKNMIFSLDASKVDSISFSSQTSQTIKDINCYQCIQPYMVMGGTVILKNTNFLNINADCYNSGANTDNPLNTFIRFGLKKPYLLSLDPITFAEILSTQTITIDSVVVDGYSVQTSGTQQGRLFEISRVLHSTLADEREPTTDQITIKNSQFKNIVTFANGPFAQVDINSIRMIVDTVTFSSISGESTTSFGGVINSISMGQLTLKSVTASNFIAKQTSATNGGGSFFYTKYAGLFTLTIVSSSFSCVTSQYSASAKTSANAGTYTRGSLFHLEGTSFTYTVDASQSTFQNCYSTQQGGALSLSSSLIMLSLSRNIFQYNTAVKGGSIYCTNCNIVKSEANVFTQDYANQGGNIYLWNLKNDMINNPVKFTYHKHTFNTANYQGGIIYYTEDDTNLRTEIKLVQDYITTGSIESEYTDNQVLTDNGGLIYAIVPKQLTLTFQKAQVNNNIAYMSGGLVYYEGYGNLITTFDLCTINFNYATNGYGAGIAASSSTKIGTVTLKRSDVNTNEAKLDGGLFYLDGSGAKTLTIDSVTIQNTKSIQGNGGIVSMRGSSSSIIVQSLADTTKTTTFSNSQTQGGSKDGGAFHSVVSANGCSLSIASTFISASYTLGKGGLYYCQGQGTGNFAITDTSIEDSKASGSGNYQKSGGVFYIELSNAITYTQTNSKIQIQSADYYGGFAYMKGSQITILIKAKSEIQQSYSKLGGGAFYLESTSGTSQVKLQDSIIVNSKTDNQGGFVYAKSSSNSEVLLETGSKVSASAAKKAGGVVYLDGSNSNTLSLKDSSKISGGESTDEWGGIAYMKGQNNYLKLLNGAIASLCSAKKGAGCFYMGGSQINQIQVISGLLGESSIQSVLLTSTSSSDLCNGGVFYLTGKTQTITFDQSLISDVKAKGNGAIIYSQVSVSGGQISFSGFDSATFSDFYALKKGSFMYIAETNSPQFNLTFSNTQFECSKLGGFGSQSDLEYVLWNLAQATPITIGGLFYFERQATGTITSTSNIFEKCNTTTEGAVFYLHQEAILTDDGSIIQSNAATKGMIFCDHCTANFTNTVFTYIAAFQASLVWLKSVTAPGVNVVFNKTTISNGFSVSHGGAVATEGQYAGIIKFVNSPVISYFTSGGDGGFFFIENPNMQMNYADTNWNHLYSYARGGFIYGNNGIHYSFSVMCKLGNITSLVDPGNVGPDSGAGGASISGCVIPCGSGIITESDYEGRLGTAKSRSSMYRYIGKNVTSIGNTFRNCLAKAGAIFNLVNSELLDVGSTFEYNGGIKGGVAYCNNCKMHFKGSIFNGNFAEMGGIAYIEGNGLLKLEDVIITQSTATQKGGIAYGEGLTPLPASPLHASVEIQIKQTGTTGLPVVFQNIKSYHDGGMVYLKNGVLVIDSSVIQDISAGDRGGLIFTEDNVQVTIKSSQFNNIKADQGGFMYSYGQASLATTSNLVFQGPLLFTDIEATTAGGAFYFNHPKLDVDMKTYIQLSNCHVTTGNGGVFYLEQIQNIDFSPPSGTISKYSDFSVKNPYYGSFMYSIARGSNINIQNCDIQCQINVPDFTLDLQQYLIDSTKVPKYGGAFYIQDANKVQTKDNYFHNCYQTTAGSIFYLKSVQKTGKTYYVTELEDLGGSVYEFNQAQKGGVLYCDTCKITLTGTTSSPIVMRNNYAQEGGAIYIFDTTTSVILGTTFVMNKATLKGGTIAISNPNPGLQGTLTISDSTFNDTRAESGIQAGDGGAIHLDTVRLSLISLISVTIKYSFAEKDGGVIFVQKMEGEVLIDQSTIEEFHVNEDQYGSMFYSGTETKIKLTMTKSYIKCTPIYDQFASAAAIANKYSSRAGAIYIESSTLGIISTLNTFSNCFEVNEGGIYFIVKSKLVDSGSTYSNIQALYGGVMKCTDCSFTFNGGNMDFNQALSGGVFMIENSASGTVTGTSFEGTKAKLNGGVMSVQQSGLNSPIETQITFKNCFNIRDSEADTGGVFYINQPYIKISLQNVKITNPKAKVAAVASIDSALRFEILGSTIEDVSADKSSILASQGDKFTLKIDSSYITCDTTYKSDDIAAYFKKGEIPFNSTNSFSINGGLNTKVEISNSNFKYCGINEDGGVFRLEGKVNFEDTGSTFQENSAIEGGVLSCSGCNITLTKTIFKDNMAQRGGVVKLEATGNLTAYQVLFTQNSASELAGVLFVTTQSLFNMKNTDFLKNYGNVSSTIDVLGGSSTQINYIDSCVFEGNKAEKNTLSLNKARAVINRSQFRDNTAKERSKNLFLGFSEVNITDCMFKSPPPSNPLKMVQYEETMGNFIFIILDVKAIITNSVFVNGLSKYGGAIYISGQSNVQIESSLFSSNYAGVYGGAIYANGFKSVKVGKNTRFLNNIALSLGDDFFMSNTEDALEMDEVYITNPMAKNSIHAEYITLLMNNVKMEYIQKNNKSEMGAAIQCIFCRRMRIDNSYFGNMRSQIGGAIYLTDSPENKRATSVDQKAKYIITNTKFEYIDAYVGGALYLDHPQSMIITDCTFNNLRALNRSSDIKTELPFGIAGALFYGCSTDDPQCYLAINGDTSFTNNFAQIKGGAIHWNYYEPDFGKKVKFAGNKAGWYGDSISCYAQQLKAINKTEFKSQIDRINNPITAEEAIKLQTSNRVLQEEATVLDVNPVKGNSSVNNLRSGGTVPEFYVAQVDKYGQIVAEFDSKVKVEIANNPVQLDENTKRYTPILGGTQQYPTFGGVAAIDDLQFSAAPGYDYKLNFLSTAIDEALPGNQEFKEELNLDQIEFDFKVGLRDCQIGEYFTQIGKCIRCDPSQGFVLSALKEPGDCKPCPAEKADCSGGSEIGPKPGYWRPSNSSSNFIKCPNPDVCLGWVSPDWNPMGQCSKGNTGVLCAECQPGYSLTGLAKCAKCPDLTSNLVKLIGMMFLVIGLFTFMVRSTLNSATQPKNNTSVYMKILMNHFQLILLVSSFNFRWPEGLDSFFKSTSPVSEASTQVISVDCFLTSEGQIGSANTNYFYTYFVKLLIFALLPFLLFAVSYLFWWIHKIVKKMSTFQKGKAISTLVISLFTIHPNIVQYMFNDFNCKEIDGEQRVYTDMTIKCYEKVHSFWSYSVAMPSIIVWGLGIPFFAFILMYRERKNLAKIETKEKFGFLYNGYQLDLFFWEIVIMYRKIAMIFISVFIQPQGVITQAMIVFLLMILFLIINMKKKPYVSIALNDLETMSLITSAASIYCGIFFISDIPQKDIKDLPDTVKGSITLSDSMRMAFFIIILLSNMFFFGYWVYKMLLEVKATLIKKFEKGYLLVFLCGDRVKLEKLKHQQRVNEENEQLREHYYKAIGNLKKLYTNGRVVLTHQTLERALVYLNEDRYLEALGLAKREISLKDQKRFSRVTQVAEIKEKEKDKHKFGGAFHESMQANKQANAPRGGKEQINHLTIDDEFISGNKLMGMSFYEYDNSSHQHHNREYNLSFATQLGLVQQDNGMLDEGMTQHSNGSSPYKQNNTEQKFMMDTLDQQTLQISKSQFEGTLHAKQPQNDDEFMTDSDMNEIKRKKEQRELWGDLNQESLNQQDRERKDKESKAILKPGEKPQGADLMEMIRDGDLKFQAKRQGQGKVNRNKNSINQPLDRPRVNVGKNINSPQKKTSVIKVSPNKSQKQQPVEQQPIALMRLESMDSRFGAGAALKQQMINSDKIEQELENDDKLSESASSFEEEDSIDAQFRAVSREGDKKHRRQNKKTHVLSDDDDDEGVFSEDK